MQDNLRSEKKEYLNFFAKLSKGDGDEIVVRCKIFLPEKVIEHPRLIIYPTRPQFDVLSRSMKKYTLSGTIGDPPQVEISGDETYIGGGTMHFGGPGLEEGYLKIYPSKLRLVHHFHAKDKGKTIILFKLTPSLLLTPEEFHESDLDGNIKVTRRGEPYRFKLAEDLELEFLNQHKRIHLENNETLSFSELVATGKLKRQPKKGDVQRFISLFDDFLLLISLAEGRRCVSPAYCIVDASKILDLFRLDRIIPDVSSKHSFNEVIILPEDFNKFINISWENLRKSNQYELIKSALEVITNDFQSSMESRFLSLFSSVETIILAFRLDNDYEFILTDHKKRESFKKDLILFIKSHRYFKGDKKTRTLIYRNISGLLRVPLSQAFQEFVKIKSLDFSDLWPFYSNSTVSLMNIRNRLAHGYGLNARFVNSFHYALLNLEYYAKRLLLASLNWNFRETRLFRMSDSEILNWRKARGILKNWL